MLCLILFDRIIKTYFVFLNGIFCLFFLTGGVKAQIGIWTSAEELSHIPMNGPAWQAVLCGAGQDCTRPDISNKDDNTNVYVLAAAIAYARTNKVEYKEKVLFACEKVASVGKPHGRTLAWARETGAYALAADLVGFRTKSFELWLRNMAEVYIGEDGRTMLKMFYKRPNNWGSHAFGSLCAIYRYLGNKKRLNDVRDYWIKAIEGSNPGLRYGKDKSWHFNKNDMHWINPKDSKKSGLNIDGIIPDDMRRGGSFQDPPIYTNYVWGGQQGFIMAARILDRAGLPIWHIGDDAIYRAAYALEVRLAKQYGLQWKAKGDDQWMLPFLDDIYDSKFVNNQPHIWQHGKNIGWGYVTLVDDFSKEEND